MKSAHGSHIDPSCWIIHSIMLNEEPTTPGTPAKAARSATMEESPSVRKNRKLLDEAAAVIDTVKRQHQLIPKTDVTFRDLKVGTTKFVIRLRVHLKCDLNESTENKVGRIIVFDKSNQSGYLVCFGEFISSLYDQIEESDLIEITDGKPYVAKKTYNLCEAEHEIIVTDSTKFKKLQMDEPFVPPFNRTNIKRILETTNERNVFDCIGHFESEVTFSQGPTGKLRATVTINDNTETIAMTAWGESAVQVLVAATKAEDQTVFAFARVKRSTFQNEVQLNLYSGSEILFEVDDPKFRSLRKHYGEYDA
jgi:hypothetical protein